MSFRIFPKLKNDFRYSSPKLRHALRAAVAITAAIAAGKSLTLSHGVWIPISVIVVLRPSLGGTLLISWKRFAGTVIGAVAGILLIYLNLSSPTVSLLVLLFSFFIFYFKIKNLTAFTATLTMSVVLVLGTVFSHTWQGGMERIFDTALGIIFGVGASFLIWPNFARKSLRKEMVGLINAQHENFKQLRKAYISNTEDTVKLLVGRLKASQYLESCSQKFKDAGIEPGLQTAQRQELLNLIDIFTKLHKILTALSSIVNKSTGVFHDTGPLEFDLLMDAVEDQFRALKHFTEAGIMPSEINCFSAAFNRFMAHIGKMRSQGKFEHFDIDRRNNSSAFIRQIHRLGTELIRARHGIEDLRKAG